MRLRHALFASVLLLAVSLFAQAQAQIGMQNLQTIGTSGKTVRINNCDVLPPATNPNTAATQRCGVAAVLASFDLKINGTAPNAITVTTSGCGLLGGCDTLDTYTTVANSLRKPTISAAYNYFTVAASWTGGNSTTSVSVGATLLPVSISSSGGGGNPNGQATSANSGPVVLASDQSPVPTQPAGLSSAVVAFQQNVTASAVALASNAVHGFCVKALAANTIIAYVGPSGVSTSTGYPLSPGDWICYQGSNTNLAYVIASSGSGAQVAVSGN